MTTDVLLLPHITDTTLIVDGNNMLLNRAQSSSNGLVVRQLLEEINSLPSPPIFVFDGYNGNDRRKAIFPNYKKRSAKELSYKADSYPTLELFRKLIGFTQAITVRVNNWEADDGIATIAKSRSAHGHKAHVVSTDRDLSQLAADPNITVAHLLKDVPPELVRLYKTVCGDSSDKIPGIPNFGPKAFEFLNTSLVQNILENALDFCNFPAHMLGLHPAKYDWVTSNQVLLHSYWIVTGLMDVPMTEITSSMQIGTSNWPAADAILKEYML